MGNDIAASITVRRATTAVVARRWDVIHSVDRSDHNADQVPVVTEP